MNGVLNRFFLGLTLVLCGFISTQAIAKGVTDQQINKILDYSGLSYQVEQYPVLMKQSIEPLFQMEEVNQVLSPKVLEKSIDKHFSPKALLHEIAVNLKSSLTKKDVEALMAWYKSDLGMRISRAEERATNLEFMMGLYGKEESLMTDKKRYQLAQQLEKLLAMTDRSMDTAKFSSKATMLMMSSVLGDKDVNEVLPGIDAQLDAALESSRADVYKYNVLSLVYMYQDFSDKEFKKYNDFNAQPATRKFNDIVMDVIMAKTDGMMIDWIESLSQSINGSSKP